MREQRKLLLMAIMAGSIMLLSLFPFQVFSQDFPTKPITIYCGFSAGATTDLTARALAQDILTPWGGALSPKIFLPHSLRKLAGKLEGPLSQLQ